MNLYLNVRISYQKYSLHFYCCFADKYMYRKFFEKLSNNKIICKICSTRMGRGNMVRHFKLKHQFVNRDEKKDNSRCTYVI